jgi:hypothetical protein
LRILSGAAAAAVLLLGATTALAHEGNPNFRSQVRSVTPAVEGVRVSVLNFDDRLELQNASGRLVLIEDYEGRPYARLKPDRTVEVNVNSEAYYLNDDRFADVRVPDDLGEEPRWKVVSRTGRFEWHDHRAHYMAQGTPPQVTDPGRRTHVFDWEVPIRIGGEPPMGLIWGSAGVLIALALAVFFVRRRRGERKPAEAW